jgi:hypothetical protein
MDELILKTNENMRKVLIQGAIHYSYKKHNNTYDETEIEFIVTICMHYTGIITHKTFLQDPISRGIICNKWLQDVNVQTRQDKNITRMIMSYIHCWLDTFYFHIWKPRCTLAWENDALTININNIPEQQATRINTKPPKTPKTKKRKTVPQNETVMPRHSNRKRTRIMANFKPVPFNLPPTTPLRTPVKASPATICDFQESPLLKLIPAKKIIQKSRLKNILRRKPPVSHMPQRTLSNSIPSSKQANSANHLTNVCNIYKSNHVLRKVRKPPDKSITSVRKPSDKILTAVSKASDKFPLRPQKKAPDKCLSLSSVSTP